MQLSPTSRSSLHQHITNHYQQDTTAQSWPCSALPASQLDCGPTIAYAEDRESIHDFGARDLSDRSPAEASCPLEISQI
jgi:hypothetical protein